ncbi:hypothetical protein OVY01_00240 [Robbsia sp. Bb-Pol-6]|uniref:Uncharacterized protein n=1 Tax=Robbsia betulipollinis TaxID=2981849 RepID=A0ABT3ZGP5_9BURK|nr:hypothetical protein [Robbsia betulipollinis]MCY0385693.1 hypothetical protein [Robbsia betulipollinis]
MPLPAAMPRDHVVIVPVRPTLSIKTRYSTTDILDALAAGAHPFESLAALGEDLSAAGAGERNPARRAAVLRIGAILDSLTGLDPKTYGYRSALGVIGIASKLLKGGQADADDMLDIGTLERNLMTLQPPARPGGESRSPTASPAQPGGKAGTTADAAPPPSPARTGALLLVTGDASDDAAWQKNAALPSGNAASPPPPPLAAGRDAAREETSVQRGDDPALLAVPRFTWRLNSDRERSSFEHADAAYDLTRGPALYTRVGNVPLLGRRRDDGQVLWESMPLSEYATPMAIPAAAPQRFAVSGGDYIGIDGVAYRVGEIEPGGLWIVHEHSGWPPLPLTRGPERNWALKPADMKPEEIDGTIASDGFLRVANRKFIRVAGRTIEIARNVIFGEESIRRFAFPEMAELGPADVSGIIRRADGSTLIEGRYGYYDLRSDGPNGRRYVGEGDGRRWVRFDSERKRWNVISGAVELENGGGGIGAPDRGEDGMSRLSPAGRHASVRKDSNRSLDSLRQYHERLGAIGFLQARPLLRAAVDAAFQGIVDLHVRRPNRTAPGGGDLSNVVSVRQEFFRKTYQAEKWNTWTVQQKQRFVSEKIFKFYAQGLYLPHRSSDALCHEMTDFITAQLMQSAALRTKILQIEFRELPGSGLGHAALLYADDAALLGRFGRIEETDPERQRLRPRLTRTEFLAFTYAHRNKVLLIDPWGLEKVIDFSAMESARAGSEAVDLNLRAAGFGEGLNDHYRVAALLPELPVGKAGLALDAKSPSRSLPSSPSAGKNVLLQRRGMSEHGRRPPSASPDHRQ